MRRKRAIAVLVGAVVVARGDVCDDPLSGGCGEALAQKIVDPSPSPAPLPFGGSTTEDVLFWTEATQTRQTLEQLVGAHAGTRLTNAST